MPTRDEVDIKDRADRLLRAGHPFEALLLYQQLLARAVLMEPGVYESWLEGALTAYRALGHKRAMGYLLLGLGRYEEARSVLDPATDPIPWAQATALFGDPGAAAVSLRQSGYLVLSIAQSEAIEDWNAARDAWDSLLLSPRLRARPYETALAYLLRARVRQRLLDGEGARRDAGEAVRLLEGLADEHETRGLRERAFDCYCLIARLGQEHGAFENIAEGYANAIRILMAEFDPYVPLQYSDDFIEAAATAKEWQAAAMCALDAAEYSRRMGLSFERHYLGRAVTLWTQAAERAVAARWSPELAESAYAAALDAAASLGDLPMLGGIYRALTKLNLPAERSERYALLAARHADHGAVGPLEPGLPAHLRQPNPYPDIAMQDLIEWELGGDPVTTLILVLIDQTHYVRFRRQALRALLMAADAMEADPPVPVASTRFVAALGNVPLYQVLAPLEALYDTPEPEVRAEVMRSVGQILNKRSFQLVRKGLEDPEPSVRAAAREALRGLKFRDGLDPLIRVYRANPDAGVREAALAAIADIGTVQAAQFLIEIVREGPAEFSALATARLMDLRDPEVLALVRNEHELAIGPERAVLLNVLTALERPES